jgi:hypothetical protein
MTPPLDPVGLLRKLSRIPSVTFNEYLVYRYLMNLWSDVAERMPSQKRKDLKFGFTPAGQLRVRWTGNPASKRRVILIAHVDKEGFLIDECASDMKSCAGWHSAIEPLSAEDKGKEVRLILRGGEYVGKIREVPEKNDTNGRRRITFDCVQNGEEHILGKVDPERMSLEPIEGYLLGIGEYRLPNFGVAEDGVISSPCVDNHAGVAVASTVLEAVCLGAWRVNIDILYTTCEEAGYCGIVEYILDSPDEIENRELVWIVVDCSNRHTCWFEDVPDALRRPAPSGRNGIAYSREVDEGRNKETDLRTVLIRTGDQRSVFSRSVGHMLHVASLNALRKIALYHRDPSMCKVPEEFLLCNFIIPEVAENPREEAFVSCARMVGGVCEGTPLVLAPEVIRRAPTYRKGGGMTKNVPVPLVGSIGIPLSNFRNTFQGKVAPEQCHFVAILMACTILGEAAKVHARYSYTNSDVLPALCQSRDADNLFNWLAKNNKYLEVTKRWAAKQHSCW